MPKNKHIEYKCEICKKKFGCQKKEYKVHILNNHATFEERKEGFNNFCELCNFGCFSNTTWQNHINTKKHQRMIEVFDSEKEKIKK